MNSKQRCVLLAGCVLLSFSSFVCRASELLPGPRVIPRPVSITQQEGRFIITPDTGVVASAPLAKKAEQLIEMLAPAAGFRLRHSASASQGGRAIVLELDDALHPLGEEGYTLTVTPSQVLIRASSEAGIFYGMQTLRQLLPVEIASSEAVADLVWAVPCVTIEDRPRFAWRAFMLDEARHFKGMEVVNKLLDQMSALKMNVFHWHLTDDQGWRIEIKKYPKLTTLGSKRTDTQIGGWNSPERSGVPHEGFYTQEEIREVVAYAAARHITIVPEIGMPGHAGAAIAAYPELGTTREKITVPVTFGKHLHTYNPASETTYAMLSDILDEVVSLFPGSFIHIGGDEVRFEQWKESGDVKALMEKAGLETMADVQIHFSNRMSQIIEAKGRRLMGWNEILGDDLHGFLINQTRSAASLSKQAVVHFWKGNPALAERAIKAGHDVVNSWHAYSYLDYGYGGIPLGKAYHFDPVFKGLKPEFHHKVMGMGCQMWGEWIPTVEKMEYQVYPRLAAFAEVGWTPPAQKDYQQFKAALAGQMKRWDLQGIGYAKVDLATVLPSDFFNVNTVGTWTPEHLENEWAEIETGTHNIIGGNDTYEAILLYQKGAHGIDISQVALYEEGKEVAVDKHMGFSGNKKKGIFYELKVSDFNPAATYTLKARVKGSGGTDSRGEIKLRQVN